jgi:DedD protein
MAKQQMDDEDSLKRQARRRLIGAVALVTAVVVILPMVLDSEPRMAGQDIDLRIPNPNKVGEFKSQIVLPADSAPAAASEPVAAAAVTAPPTAAENKPPATVENKPQAAASKSEKTAPVARTEHKPAEKQHAVPKEGFAVQVGAFSNAATAKQWQEKLHRKGFRAYTEKVGSNVRVRIGPYPTRQAADKDLHKLEAQGMHPVLTTLN